MNQMEKDNHDHHQVKAVIGYSGSGSYLTQHLGTFACLIDTGTVKYPENLLALQGLSGGAMVSALISGGLVTGFSDKLRARIKKASYTEKYKQHLVDGFERTEDSAYERVLFLTNEFGDWNEESELSWKLGKRWWTRKIWNFWWHGGMYNLKDAWGKLWELLPEYWYSDEWDIPTQVYAWKCHSKSPVFLPTTEKIVDESSPYKYYVYCDPELKTEDVILWSSCVPFAVQPQRWNFKGNCFPFHEVNPPDHEDVVLDGALQDNNIDPYFLGKSYEHLNKEVRDGCTACINVESIDILKEDDLDPLYLGRQQSAPKNTWWRKILFINAWNIFEGSILGMLRAKAIEHYADYLVAKGESENNHFIIIPNNKASLSDSEDFKDIILPPSTQFTDWTKEQVMASVWQGYESCKLALDSEDK